ncbi:hypothetical protein DAI22_11g142700 [Oryza sativa Japonica Group]|nr:hypothetical protein DAI22_11g142700 [Oryza sativa Japonica Group]
MRQKGRSGGCRHASRAPPPRAPALDLLHQLRCLRRPPRMTLLRSPLTPHRAPHPPSPRRPRRRTTPPVPRRRVVLVIAPLPSPSPAGRLPFPSSYRGTLGDGDGEWREVERGRRQPALRRRWEKRRGGGRRDGSGGRGGGRRDGGSGRKGPVEAESAAEVSLSSMSQILF